MKTNWQTKKFGEVFDENKKSKIKVRDSLGVGKYVFFKSGDKTNFLNNFLIDGRNIFLATGGKAIIKFYNGKCAYSTDTYSIKGRNLDTKFLYYFLFSIIDIINDKMFKGAAIKHLQKKDFKEMKISFPKFSKEQKRIVKVLDRIFEKTAEAKKDTEKNIQNTKDLFESYLQNVFINSGKDWEEKRLGEILEIERGGSPRPINSFLTDDENGINWIKIGDTKNVDKYIYKTKQKIIPEGLKKSRLVNEGDFILSNSMSFGRPYIMKTTGAIHDGWLVLREKNSNVINKDYLYIILNSPYVFNQFDRLAAGSTVRNLNISLVSSVKILFPSILEQKFIVKKLDKLSVQTKKLEEIYKKKLLDLEELKKSVLKRAFNGEL